MRAGEAIRISTGGAVPDGATAVVPQENVEVENGAIRTLATLVPGEHVRAPGEDILAGTLGVNWRF